MAIRDCRTGKIRYGSKAAAEAALSQHQRKSERKGPWRMSEYRCLACGGWHLGHARKRPEREPVIQSTSRRAEDLRAYLATVRVQAGTRAGITERVRWAAYRAEIELAVLDAKAMKQTTREAKQ